VFDAMALNPAPLALTAARQWLSVLRPGGSKKTRFAKREGINLERTRFTFAPLRFTVLSNV